MRALADREKKLNPSFHGRAFCHNFEGLHGLSRIPAALAGNPRTGAPKEQGVSWLGGSPIKKATTMPANKKERHRTGRIGWLRAAVLGANDGILSTSSRIGSFRAPLFKGRHPLPE